MQAKHSGVWKNVTFFIWGCSIVPSDSPTRELHRIGFGKIRAVIYVIKYATDAKDATDAV